MRTSVTVPVVVLFRPTLPASRALMLPLRTSNALVLVRVPGVVRPPEIVPSVSVTPATVSVRAAMLNVADTPLTSKVLLSAKTLLAPNCSVPALTSVRPV